MNLLIAIPAILALISGAMAGKGNCKCQDPSGVGPQWNEYTYYCCKGDRGTVDSCWNFYYPGPNHQCTGDGSNCPDNEGFDLCCRSMGAPGAFCWD